MSVALVTGANRGLGYATARALAQSGICVIVTGRDAARTEQAAAGLREEGFDVQAVTMDVTSATSVAEAALDVSRRLGRLDVLVNNAGILPEAVSPHPEEFAAATAFEATFATNVVGVVTVTEAFLPLLRRSPVGRIVNVSSRMGSLADHGDPDSAFAGVAAPAYRSSKAALNSVTVSLANLLADTSIKVTSVCPGFVRTDLTPSNREHAPLDAAEAAQVVVAAATLPDDAPSGTFVDRDGPVPW